MLDHYHLLNAIIINTLIKFIKNVFYLFLQISKNIFKDLNVQYVDHDVVITIFMKLLKILFKVLKIERMV